jgi:hypothetical protein
MEEIEARLNRLRSPNRTALGEEVIDPRDARRLHAFAGAALTAAAEALLTPDDGTPGERWEGGQPCAHFG